MIMSRDGRTGLSGTGTRGRSVLLVLLCFRPTPVTADTAPAAPALPPPEWPACSCGRGRLTRAADAMESDIQCVRTRWIRGFIASPRVVRPAWRVMLTVPVWREFGLCGG